MSRLAAGELDTRISIRRAALVDDGFSKNPGTPTQIAKRWAKVTEMPGTFSAGGERPQAGENAQSRMTKFTVRSDPVTRTVTGKDFVVARGLTYEVTDALPSRERLDAIEIVGVARPDR